MKRYDKNSSELISRLRKNGREEIRKQNLIYGYHKNEIDIYQDITKALVSLTKDRYFLKDSSIQAQVDFILDKLYNHNPWLTKINTTLISRESFPNARSHGDGTISLNIGLLSRIKKEGQLAFIIAHEIAHYHLNHTFNSIKLNEYIRNNTKLKRKTNKIIKGTSSLEEHQYVQYIYNSLSKRSRSQELEADSLANIIIRNSGYTNTHSLEALNLLKTGIQPKYPLEEALFDNFIFEEYPFKKEWLNPRSSYFDKNYMLPILNFDSMHTHPNVDDRIKNITTNTNERNTNGYNKEFHSFSNAQLDQEVIAGAYENYNFDQAMHLALQLKQIEPTNSFANFFISRILLELAYLKLSFVDHNDHFMAIYTKSHSSEFKALNAFLHNLKWQELAELSYHYIIEGHNFDNSCPDHHRLKYNICAFTGRRKEAKQIRKKFYQLFPDQEIATHNWISPKKSILKS